MAEALTVIAAVSAIVQFVDVSAKTIERLDEFLSNIHEVPQTFRDLKVQLPLLRETLTRTKAEADAGLIDADTQGAMLEAVKGCQLQVQLLDEVLVKALSAPADSPWRGGTNDFHSNGQDVRKIVDRIQRYQISLIQHHTTPFTLTLPTKMKPLFTVPFAQDPRFTGRRDELKRIDQHFQTDRPVVLTGLGGLGYGFLLSTDLRCF
jgi:N-terminal domain on NACHT_NTPase and P-loop NTPases